MRDKISVNGFTESELSTKMENWFSNFIGSIAKYTNVAGYLQVISISSLLIVGGLVHSPSTGEAGNHSTDS